MAREIRNASAGVFAALRIATLTRRAKPNGQGVCVHVGEDEHILGYVFDQKGADAFGVLDQLTHALRVADLVPLFVAGGAGAAYAGQHLPLLLNLSALPPEAEAGWPLGRLAERAGLVRLPCPEAVERRLRGANTPQEREALLAELQDDAGAQSSGDA